MTPVEEIKERLNIVNVVQEYVPLKKTGANHKGRCPFHNEKTPSFTVSESKQFFHCFGCAKGGDLFTFIQEIESVEFAEALRMLAKKAGVELKKVDPKERNEKSRMLDCLQLAAQFFHTAYKESKEGERARTYLYNRGVTSETITTFQIGYSAHSWDALMNFLRKKGFKIKEIEKAGLIIPSEKTGGYYDRFRGRLMFPIQNAYGNVIGFGARTLDSEQKEAKYINSPQSAVYNKSEALYGLDLAKQFIKKMDATVVMEGYMDVVTAHQAKFRNVVASSGTALTEGQIRLLKRFSKNLLLAFDADSAGLSAAWRGMQVAIQQGMNIKVIALPEGEDPDALIRKDPEHFRKLAIDAKPFMEYAFSAVMETLDLSTVQDKKKAAQKLLPMIALFPDKIEQTHYAQQLAKKLDVEVAILLDKVSEMNNTDGDSRITKKGEKKKEKQVTIPEKKSYGEQQTERLLILIIKDPQDFSVVQQKLKREALHGENFKALYKFLENTYNHSGTIESEQLEFHNEQLRRMWTELSLIAEELYHEITPQQRQQELLALLESLERHRIKERMIELQKKLAIAEKNHDASTIETLSAEFSQLTYDLKKLA